MKKIYVYDAEWQGATICVAESAEEALRKMIAADELSRDFYEVTKHIYTIEEYDLDAVFTTRGDI